MRESESEKEREGKKEGEGGGGDARARERERQGQRDRDRDSGRVNKGRDRIYSWGVIKSPWITPQLYSPMYGRVEGEGLVTSGFSLPLSQRCRRHARPPDPAKGPNRALKAATLATRHGDVAGTGFP